MHMEKQRINKSWVKLGLTKKLFIDAAMKVPGSTLRTRTKVSTLKYRLHVRQACSVHCKGIVRLDSSESFGPIRSGRKVRVTVESLSVRM